MSTASASNTPLLSAALARRTIYQLGDTDIPISDARIHELVNNTVLHVPSAFNSQTSRVVLLLGEEHKRLWDLIMDVYRQQLSEDKFKSAEGKFKGFRAGYGTILFYEDNDVVCDFATKFKRYAEHFRTWSDQTSGMHQYMLWTALEAEGLGVNLQHYNPLIDVRVATQYDIPEPWMMKAQMVFGKPLGGPNPNKEFKPLEERVKVFGAK
ncbi:MAG: hypothetical protein Q9214_006085 [Letrouitia sp. 1 TL-2023]